MGIAKDNSDPLSPAARASGIILVGDPGAHAPGFTLSSAPRTGISQKRCCWHRHLTNWSSQVGQFPNNPSGKPHECGWVPAISSLVAALSRLCLCGENCSAESSPRGRDPQRAQRKFNQDTTRTYLMILSRRGCMMIAELLLFDLTERSLSYGRRHVSPALLSTRKSS